MPDVGYTCMKNILVVGGSSGIGKTLVKQLAENSYHVLATHYQTPVEELDGVEFHSLNVLDETLDLSFLPDQLHGLVYCPGSINLKPFARIKPTDFAHDFELQVNGAIKVLQTALPHLKAAEKASVVFFSTVAVQLGFNFHSQVAASKGAIEGLTRALSAEFAPHIRFNAIAPSLTHTPLAGRMLSSDEKIEANAKRHPLQSIGQPEDMAHMAQFLLGEESKWITGQVLKVDGGMSSIRG